MIKNCHTNTIPYICHFPGRSYRKHYGKEIFKYMNEHRVENIIIPDNLAVISFKTCDEESLLESQLKKNANFFSYQITDIKWQHIYRIQLILNRIENITQEYILHLDAYDVMFNQSNLSGIVENITDRKIIFNAEKNFYNNINDISITKNIKSTFDKIYDSYIYKYLNAGCFIGQKKDIIYFFTQLLELIKNPSTAFSCLSCDQAAIQLYWFLYDNILINPNTTIQLDNGCNLFMCMNYLNQQDIDILCK